LKLPVVSGQEIVKILTKLNFKIVGRKGSHIRLKKTNEETLIVIVPDHQEIAKGTLRSILRQANLTPEVFLRLV